MVIEFSISNFKSIKEKQRFSMVPERKVKEHPDAILSVEKYQALSCSIIYGRNASGKSNLINAFSTLQKLVIESGNFEIGGKIPFYEPFKLDNKSKERPTEFKIDFIAKNGVRYLYEVSYTSETIIKEALYFYPKNQIAKLFERLSGNKVTYGEYYSGRKKELADSVYDNQLLLSKVRTEKVEILVQPYLFFHKLIFISNVHDSSYDELLLTIYSNRAANKKNPHFFHNISKLLKTADTGIDSLSISENKFDELSLPYEMAEEEKKRLIERYKYKLRTTRNIFEDGLLVGKTDFTLLDESTGTLKLFVVGGLIIEALADGQTLIIDELDKSLHPKLTRALIKIFMNKKTNPNKAQLIFATHDVSLLDLEFFRRDQIWFVEKEYEGNSTFYSVSDISGIRKNVPLEKWYTSGRLGGTPEINQNELEFQF